MPIFAEKYAICGNSIKLRGGVTAGLAESNGRL